MTMNAPHSAGQLQISVSREIPPCWPAAADAGDAELHVFQTREFIAAWQRSFGASGAREGYFVVVANDAGQPVLLLPLAIERRLGTRILGFMDHGHADYNAPVLFPAAATVSAAEMPALWRRILAALPRVDVVRLTKMPHMIGEASNPFRGLAPEADIESCHGNRLDQPWPEVERHLESPRELRKKQRSLAKRVELRFVTPPEAGEQQRLITEMIRQKQRRFEETGVPGYADNPDALAFLHAATKSFGASGNLVVNALLADGAPLAVQWGLSFNRRFYALITTFAGGEWTPFSCGRILAYLLLKQCHEQGFAYFDQGVGDEPYKLRNSDTTVPLDRLIAPLSLRGRLFVARERLREAARSSALGRQWRALKRARRERLPGKRAAVQPEAGSA